MRTARVKKSFKITWTQATEDELEVESGPRGNVLPQHKITLKFLYADRLAARAAHEVDPLLIKRALREIFFAGVLMMQSPQLTKEVQFAAATMALTVARQTRTPKLSRQQIERLVAEWKRQGVRPNLALVLHNISIKRLEELVRVAGDGATIGSACVLPSRGYQPVYIHS